MSHDETTNGVTRRDVLKTGAGGAAALSGLSLLSACGSSTGGGTASSAGASAGKPKLGGTLTVGMITGGATETLAVGLGVALADTARILQLYEGLYSLTPDNKPKLALAEEGESDAKAKNWTFRIRDGVVFHNGKPLTADDVVYTVKTWSDEKVSYLYPVVGPYIDFKNVKKRDSRTVEIPLLKAIAEFPSLLSFLTAGIIPEGFTDFTHPVGTGPFQYKSFNPGRQTVFAKNPNYWEHGKPYVDELVIDSSFTNDETRTNALLSDSVNITPQLPFSTARQYENGTSFRVSSAEGPQFQAFYLRVDKGAGKDPRVRQAMKYLVDRPAMINGALAGLGTPGNDLCGYSLPYFDEELKRERDLEKAVSLLKAAGQEDLHLTLKTSTVSPGFVESATLLQQQAAEAGVTIDLERVDPTIYFSPAGGYLSNEFAQDVWSSIPSLTAFYLQGLVKNGPYNPTHFGDPKSEALLAEALAAVDPNAATERWKAVQEEQFEQGGYVIWDRTPFIDGYANNVNGIETTPAGLCNNWNFKTTWLT